LKPKRSKYGAVAGWHTIGGKEYYFRSLLEYRYALRLQMVMESGGIREWAHEIDTFWFEGIRRGVTNYKPDFRITENNGKIWYAETKGFMDSKSKTKIKRMAKYHPNVELRVITKV
jgi:hypothetical protein